MVQIEVHRSPVLHSRNAGKSKDVTLSCLEQPIMTVVKGGDRKAFFPCSGNGNGASWNNRGGNGNYWSASFNSAVNARNLNFNGGGVNPQNNNNRYNGFTVRPVQHSTAIILLNIKKHDSYTGETSVRLVCCLLRRTEAQGKPLIREAMGERPEKEHGRIMRRSVLSPLQASPVEMLHSGLSKEEGDLRCNVQGQDSASPVLQLYPQPIREDIYQRLVQLYQGTWNALRNPQAGRLLQEGIEELATEMLRDALRHQGLLHAHRAEAFAGDSLGFVEEDVNTPYQQGSSCTVERQARHGFSVLPDGNNRDARSERELYHLRGSRRLERSGSSKVDASPDRRSRTSNRQPDFTTIQQCISERVRPVHEESAEMPLLRQICGRCSRSVIRQGMATEPCAGDRTVLERRAWTGTAQGETDDLGGASRRGVPRIIYQALANIHQPPLACEDHEKVAVARLHEASEGAEKHQLLSWNLPAYGIIQYQAQAVYEKGNTQARSLRRRTDQDNRETFIQLLTN